MEMITRREITNVTVFDKKDPFIVMFFKVKSLEEFVNEFWKNDDADFQRDKYTALLEAFNHADKNYIDIDDEFLYSFS